MKNEANLIAILLFLGGVINSQNCCVPQVLRNSYERDVKSLALSRMQLFNAPEQDLIEIDQLWQDTIWEGLGAIYQTTSTGSIDVFNRYCIHNSNDSGLSRSMYVQADSTSIWYQNWLDGNVTTGDSYIDSLTLKYGFNQISILLANLGVFVISTDQHVNSRVWADSLELHERIILVEPASAIGDGPSIRYEKENSLRNYYFEFGWGDCPSGCLYNHTWSFVVDEDCNAFTQEVMVMSFQIGRLTAF